VSTKASPKVSSSVPSELSKWVLADGRPDFTVLFHDARSQLLAVARRVVRNDSDAEDVVQQAFENAIKSKSVFEGRAQATSWMYRIVYNTGLMHLRSRRRKGTESLDALAPEVGEAVMHGGLSDDSTVPAPDDVVERGALVRALQAAMSELSDLDRNIVRMRLYEERSTSEVSKALGLSTAAVKTRLYRARVSLQGFLGTSDFSSAQA
jgi:RNA polymerase sigma-70 factor (ECF subfamily)